MPMPMAMGNRNEQWQFLGQVGKVVTVIMFSNI